MKHDPNQIPIDPQIQLAEHAIELLRYGWCKYGEAETPYGTTVDYSDPYASKFCLMGAVWRAEMEKGLDESFGVQLLQTIDNLVGDAANFNDYHANSVDDVIGLLNTFIKRRRSKLLENQLKTSLDAHPQDAVDQIDAEEPRPELCQT